MTKSMPLSNSKPKRTKAKPKKETLEVEAIALELPAFVEAEIAAVRLMSERDSDVLSVDEIQSLATQAGVSFTDFESELPRLARLSHSRHQAGEINPEQAIAEGEKLKAEQAKRDAQFDALRIEYEQTTAKTNARLDVLRDDLRRHQDATRNIGSRDLRSPALDAAHRSANAKIRRRMDEVGHAEKSQRFSKLKRISEQENNGLISASDLAFVGVSASNMNHDSPAFDAARTAAAKLLPEAQAAFDEVDSIITGLKHSLNAQLAGVYLR